MPILLCPGVHPPAYTAGFLRAFPTELAAAIMILPNGPSYSGWHLLTFLQQQIPLQQRQQPLQIVAFSAGVVGAATAIPLWQASGGCVQSLFAIDGWGVPLISSCFAPVIYRLSHDRFTDWSSALLGAGRDRFFADPPVAHLELWRVPQTVRGWAIQSGSWEQTTAADFLIQRLTVPVTEPTGVASPS